jgi:hypothetical protein
MNHFTGYEYFPYRPSGKMIIDGDQMKVSVSPEDPEIMDRLMSRLRDMVKELEVDCKIVVVRDGVLVDLEAGSFTEDMVIKFGRQHKTVALSCGKPLSAIKDGLLADIYDLEAEAENTHKPVYLPPKESWKQGRLRRGPGHNKHSRKGKRK